MRTYRSTASLFERFAEAVAELRSRIAITDDEYQAMVDAIRLRVFRVSGLQQLRLVQHVLDSLARALERGEGLDVWRRQLGEDIRNAWGAGSAFRLETIFRTNIQTALNRGRYAQMTHPSVLRLRPYWMYDAVLDSHTSPICRERDQVVKPANDPYWQTGYPPLHHRCRGAVRTLRKRQAERRGITDISAIQTAPGAGFGAPPTHSTFIPDLTNTEPGLRAIYEGS